jgi:hypothetical protein
MLGLSLTIFYHTNCKKIKIDTILVYISICRYDSIRDLDSVVEALEETKIPVCQIKLCRN